MARTINWLKCTSFDDGCFLSISQQELIPSSRDSSWHSSSAHGWPYAVPASFDTTLSGIQRKGVMSSTASFSNITEPFASMDLRCSRRDRSKAFVSLGVCVHGYRCYAAGQYVVEY